MILQTAQLIEDYLKKNKEEMLKDLMTLSSIPSVQSAAEPGKPFGPESRRALDRAVQMFEQNSFHAQVCSDGKYGLAYSGEGEKEIGIYAHCDVVPVEADKWIYTKPFEPIIKDGCVIGRGIRDNKAGVIMALYALRALRDCGIKIKSKLTVFLGANEENGMVDITAFRNEQKMPDFSIVPDNSYPICLGEKGIYHLTAKCERAFEDIIDFCGGLAVNVILGEATVRIKANAALSQEIKNYCNSKKEYSVCENDNIISITGYGITSHGSRPEGSLNAGKLICSALLACPSLNKNDREIISDIAYLLSDDYGKQFGIEANDPHFGKTTTTNGIVSVCDGHFSLTFDIRYGTVNDSHTVENNVVSALTAKGFTVSQSDNRSGFRVPEDSAEIKAMIDVYRELSGDKECRPYYSGGGTYARYLKNAVSIGVEAPYAMSDKIDLPAGHGGAHQSDEIITINGLLESVKLLAVMLYFTDDSITKK